MLLQRLLKPEALLTEVTVEVVDVGVRGQVLLHAHGVGTALAAHLAGVRVLPRVRGDVAGEVRLGAVVLATHDARPQHPPATGGPGYKRWHRQRHL